MTACDRSLPRKQLNSIAAYNAGLTVEAVRDTYNLSRVIKLASNENPLGPSPRVDAMFDHCRSVLARYPDPTAAPLRMIISARVGVPPSRITIGNGSESLIESLCLAYVDPGDRVVTVSPAFDLHVSYPQILGARVDQVPLDSNLEFDVQALIAAIRVPTRILMFSNPSNPVGCRLTTEGLQEIVRSVSPDTLVVVDEAYFEYGQLDGCASAIAVLRGFPGNWVVLRTFSKAYGLAGLRIGYAIASDAEVIEALNTVKPPFNVNVAAQMAAAEAHADTDHVVRSVRLVRQERPRVAAALTKCGFRVAPSAADFLFIDTGEDSERAANRLLRQGIIIKPWRTKEYSTFVRVTMGASDENDAFLQAFLPHAV